MSDLRRLINLVEGVEESRLDELRFPFFRKKSEPTPQVDLSRIERKPQAPVEPSVASSHGAPEIGAIFQYNGRSFAVAGWMTEATAKGVFGRRNRSLVACRPQNATWVLGLGGAGCVAPLAEIRLTGENKWADDAEASKTIRGRAEMLVANKYTIKNPKG